MRHTARVAAAAIPARSLARRIAPLTAGHIAVDFTQTALPVLLPLLHDRHGLSYWQDAALYAASTFSSSVVQPIFGLVADQRERRLLLPLSVLLSGGGLAAAAYAPTYLIAFLCALVSGFGVAAYHPEASRTAARLSGDRVATGMSYFSVGGTAGFVLGSVVAGVVSVTLGLDGGIVLAVPAVIAALLLLRTAASVRAGMAAAATAAAASTAKLASDVRSLVILLIGLCLRGYVNFATLVFVVLYEEDGRGRSHGYAIVVFALMLGLGVVTTLASGPLADRFGPRRTMLAMSLLVPPLIAVYALDGSLLGAACIILAGGLVVGTFGISVVLAQRYLPSRVALASGLSIGFSIGVGGLLSLVMGWIADTWGFDTAFLSAAAVGVAAAGMLALLPRDASPVR